MSNRLQELAGIPSALGFQPGKISKSAVRSEVEKVLTKLGYK